ncbi:hypothetical protein ILUMI_15893 [Ignelater luminosus]|uniref:Uncharacterized protein n=1 Tax=Ignelater luminosus TaxID=2038154 RepID=A0A8K0G3F2_IGNLU|nr:hypothetical protein ILUMI_15893 [Ignelater luminosus]
MKQTLPCNRNSQKIAVGRKEEKLNHPKAQTKYRREMQGKPTNIHEKKEIEDMWQTITLTMEQAIKTLQTEKQVTRNADWFDEECEREVAKRKKTEIRNVRRRNQRKTK